MRPSFLGRAMRRWTQTRRRWPLTQQMAVVFAAVVLGNATMIITATTAWQAYATPRYLAKLTPDAKEAFEDVLADRLPDRKQLAALQRESKILNVEMQRETETVLYICIGLAALLSFGVGLMVLRRLGRGLSMIALAARQIADGDLNARAEEGGFSSSEETALTADFNRMAAALQRAERELAESTAAIAHELRTPLTILRGRLHGMQDGLFPLEPHEVTGLLYQVEGLGRLIDDLQTISLANSGRLIINAEPTNLADEVRRVLTVIEPDLLKSGLEPALDLAEARLCADGARLRQVIIAVLSNACRYAANSGVIRLSTRCHGSEVSFEVVDHGPGLPENAQEMVFDRFWRGEVSRGRHGGGSGLGLAVVRTIVEAHGGRVHFCNHVGGGTIFTLWLSVDHPAPQTLHNTLTRAKYMQSNTGSLASK